MNSGIYRMGAAAFFAACLIFFTYRVYAATDTAPQLYTLYVQDGTNEYDTARITFDPGRAATCYIYRKVKGGNYSLIGRMRSSGGMTSFTDEKLPRKGEYTYTVRCRRFGLSDRGVGSYDHEGLSTIRGRSEVSAKVTNLHSVVTWTPNRNAVGYRIYRRLEGKNWRYIATVGSDSTVFTDIYSETFSLSEQRDYLLNNCYLDTSSHTVSYTVRGVRRYSDFDKQSLSPYQKDGYFTLNAPVIIDCEKNADGTATVAFTNVAYATRYRVSVYRTNPDRSTSRITKACVFRTKEAYIDSTITLQDGYDYISVTAYARRNGRQIRSRSMAGFTMKYRKYSRHKILYIGDSITYGSPYKTDITKYVFSYPWRVSELTDAYYYNAAIPGATMAYMPTTSASFHRYRIITDVVPQLSIGATPIATPGLLEPNDHSLSYFDTIVICAGTNDYTDVVPIGSINSEGRDSYLASLNVLMKAIKHADTERIKKGKSHINIIMPDLFYSNRTTSFVHPHSRYSTKNRLGFTLRDYNDAKNRIIKKYKKEGLKVYRFKTSSYVNRNNCARATADNLHMTRYTYEKIGNDLASFMIKLWSLAE